MCETAGTFVGLYRGGPQCQRLIRRINRGAIGLLAQPAQLTRTIAAVHVHDTGRPPAAGFRGLATVEAMRKFHMEQNGWSDLAQHLTIDPKGGLWTGRNWNLAPASATGHNATAGEGPFMIEMVGDFDAGQDPFAQLGRASRCGRRPNGVVHM
jgi:hypothetical protein